MKLDKDLLKSWSPCTDGFQWFLKNFPQGEGITEINTALRAERRYDDSNWLINRVFESFVVSPENIASYTDDTVKATLKETEDAEQSASGDYSTAASSGYSSKAASSGYSSKAASSGYSSKAASSGNSSKAASSGYYSKAASSGNSSKAASSGYYSTAASSGNSSKAASSGYSSKAASSGYSSKAASSGYYSTAASSGYYSTAASSGNSSKAEAKGEKTIAMVAGVNGRAKVGVGGVFALPYLDENDKLRVAVGIEGENIVADTWYSVTNGELVQA